MRRAWGKGLARAGAVGRRWGRRAVKAGVEAAMEWSIKVTVKAAVGARRAGEMGARGRGGRGYGGGWWWWRRLCRWDRWGFTHFW